MTLVQEKIYYKVVQPKPEKPTTKEWVRPLWFLFTVGWYVVLSLVIPTLIGYWLDRPERFDTRPLFTLIGFVLGSVIAFYGLYRMLRQFYREQKEQDKSKEPK
jgi:F0F1-type ATP synthase assembly protein I